MSVATRRAQFKAADARGGPTDPPPRRRRRRRIGFAIEDGRRLGGLTHFDLLNHPAVYDQIRAWIER
jgi:hypothetical protein